MGKNNSLNKSIKKPESKAETTEIKTNKVEKVEEMRPKTPGKMPGTKESFTCEECEKKGEKFFSSIVNVFEQHINMKHPNYKPFKCTLCNYTTHKKGNLNKHMRLNHKG